MKVPHWQIEWKLPRNREQFLENRRLHSKVSMNVWRTVARCWLTKEEAWDEVTDLLIATDVLNSYYLIYFFFFVGRESKIKKVSTEV